MTRDLTIRDAIARLRENPDDRVVLTALLDYLAEQEAAYYRVGDLYAVPVAQVGTVTKELAGFGDRCCLRCKSLGCPGRLRFRDGTEVCPMDQRVVRAITTDPHFTPVQLVQRLLYRGVSRGSVELPDGRKITLTVRKVD